MNKFKVIVILQNSIKQHVATDGMEVYDYILKQSCILELFVAQIINNHTWRVVLGPVHRICLICNVAEL